MLVYAKAKTQPKTYMNDILALDEALLPVSTNPILVISISFGTFADSREMFLTPHCFVSLPQWWEGRVLWEQSGNIPAAVPDVILRQMIMPMVDPSNIFRRPKTSWNLAPLPAAIHLQCSTRAALRIFSNQKTVDRRDGRHYIFRKASGELTQ